MTLPIDTLLRGALREGQSWVSLDGGRKWIRAEDAPPSVPSGKPLTVTSIDFGTKTVTLE